MSVHLPPRAVHTATITAIGVVTAYVATVTWATSNASFAVWAALVWIPLIVLANIPLVFRAGRRDPDPRFLRLLCWAFVLKMLATVARYLMAFVLYDGQADASTYDAVGAELALSYRDGDFGAEIGRKFIGTGFIRVFTGLIYTVTGPSIYIAYAVYSLLGFWGLYFFYRAFRTAVPDSDGRRYALLVLLLPSMLFWPSGLGKEAWMTFGIGLVAYGCALLFNADRRWVFPLLAGIGLTALVRPHVTAALFAGVAAAFLLRRNPKPANELTPLARAAGLVTIMAAGLLLVTQAANFLGIDEVTSTNVDASIENTSDRTSGGDSSFDAEPVNSPLDMPMAMLSVLFRPFIYEAGNAQMLIAALEGTLLLALLCFAVPRLRGALTRLRRQPYLIFSIAYALLFIYAFSNFSNFGILTRQRVQILPFILVFLCLPRHAAATAPSLPDTDDGTMTERSREVVR